MSKSNEARSHKPRRALFSAAVAALALGMAGSFFPTGLPTKGPAGKTPRSRAEAFPQIPLSFEANHGQADPGVLFSTRMPQGGLALTPDGAVFSLRGEKDRASVVMQPLGSARGAVVEGLGQLEARTNYLIGDDPSRWHRGVTNYSEVRYRGLYPGVDLSFQENGTSLEYSFVVSRGHDPSLIQLGFQGQGGLSIDSAGDLVIKTPAGDLIQHRPVAFQEFGGRRHKVTARFKLEGNSRVSFELGAYDTRHGVTIDPVIAYSTYFGGPNQDYGLGITSDSSGDAYLVGQTNGPNFQLPGALRPPNKDNCYYSDPLSCQYAFVAKVGPTGKQLIWSTFLGGTKHGFGYYGPPVDSSDTASAVAVDSAQNVFVTGYTDSPDFPVYPHIDPANRRSFGGVGLPVAGGQGGYNGPPWQAFAVKMTPDGASLKYATILGAGVNGGAVWGFGVAVDSSDNAWITGSTQSSTYPTTSLSFESVCECAQWGDGAAFATRLSPDGTINYSTFIGHTLLLLAAGENSPVYVAVDPSGDAWVAGATTATDFPTTPGAYDQHGGAGLKGFLSRIHPGSRGPADLAYSTLLGGGDTSPYGLALDPAGDAYVTGNTTDQIFPVTSGAYETHRSPGFIAFLSKIHPAGHGVLDLAYSTYLHAPQGEGVGVDPSGSAYVTGSNFVTRLDRTGSHAFYVYSFPGFGYAAAVDSTGVYVGGTTGSPNFNTFNAFQPKPGGGQDGFAMKIPTPVVSAVDPPRGPVTGGTKVTVTGRAFDEAYRVRFETGATGGVIPPLPEGVPAPPGGVGVSALTGNPASFIDVDLHPCGASGGTGQAPCFSLNSPTQITVYTPAHPAGPVDVVVWTTWGPSIENPGDVFTYVDVGPQVQGTPQPPPSFPQVSGVVPSRGPEAGGDKVVVSGKNLDGTSTVLFGEIPVASHPCPAGAKQGQAPCFSVDSSSQITVFDPAHAAGRVHVRVRTPKGLSSISAADLFEYFSIPAVQSQPYSQVPPPVQDSLRAGFAQAAPGTTSFGTPSGPATAGSAGAPSSAASAAQSPFSAMAPLSAPVAGSSAAPRVTTAPVSASQVAVSGLPQRDTEVVAAPERAFLMVGHGSSAAVPTALAGLVLAGCFGVCTVAIRRRSPGWACRPAPARAYR